MSEVGYQSAKEKHNSQRELEFMTTRAGTRYREGSEKNPETIMSAELGQILQALLEDRQSREKELPEERQRRDEELKRKEGELREERARREEEAREREEQMRRQFELLQGLVEGVQR